MDTRLRPSEMLCWGTLGSVRPFPDFQPERDVVDLQTAVDQKDINTLVRILTNRSSAQRQTLTQDYQTHMQKELKAGLKKVLSGDLESLMLGLMMTPEQFEAHRLRQAMEGVGTDEETLLEILCTRTPQQLSNIKAVYNEEYKRDLEKDLISETSGDFTKLLVALLKKEYRPGHLESDVQVLSEELSSKKATAGPWIQILTSRSPDHLRKVLIDLEAEREQPVAEIIEKRFGGILSGDLKLGLLTLMRCIENQHLYLAQRILNMKGSVLQGVLVSHCEEDLLAVRVAYKTHTGTSLYTTLQKQFKGELQQALLAICCAED
ncbi:annexin A2 [Colossoma macropomum]|uniref:annexin A2 n=1 Tax=Colossoma macropomum TaxID=42526 RepID=UPI001863E9B5|nr:annexin A2 [Colossoma macropomum]